MVEKALAATAVVYAGHLKSAAGSCHVAFRPQLVNAEKSGNDYSQLGSYRVSTENGWESVLLGNLNRFNRNQLRLKRLRFTNRTRPYCKKSFLTDT